MKEDEQGAYEERLRALNTERERRYRLAIETRCCPKCKERGSLIELADGSLFCKKCKSIFSPHIEMVYFPLGSKPAGKDQWDGSMDNAEKVIERDKW